MWKGEQTQMKMLYSRKSVGANGPRQLLSPLLLSVKCQTAMRVGEYPLCLFGSFLLKTDMPASHGGLLLSSHFSGYLSGPKVFFSRYFSKMERRWMDSQWF